MHLCIPLVCFFWLNPGYSTASPPSRPRSRALLSGWDVLSLWRTPTSNSVPEVPLPQFHRVTTWFQSEVYVYVCARARATTTNAKRERKTFHLHFSVEQMVLINFTWQFMHARNVFICGLNFDESEFDLGSFRTPGGSRSSRGRFSKWRHGRPTGPPGACLLFTFARVCGSEVSANCAGSARLKSA